MLEKCVLTILELNWNQRLGHKWTKLNICHHLLTSSTQLQNGSFHVVERTRTSTECQKIKNARAKRAKILFFIVKYANLWGFCCRRRLGCLSSLLLDYPPVSCGMLQGSLLGPLFLIYINDLQECELSSSPLMFADDTSRTLSAYDPTQARG